MARAGRRRRAPPRLAAAGLHAPAARPAGLPRHHLLAYVWMLAARPRALRFAAEQTAALPLGAGALAGVNFDTDRGAGRRRARLRRASRPTRSTPSPTATSSWTTCSAAATCATHLSRLGAELVLWSIEEFGFVELPDAWTSGSSIMPQKKNPDAAELLRAKAPRIVGAPRGAARRHARAAADLQQGPAGGQGAPLRRRRHARRCASPPPPA